VDESLRVWYNDSAAVYKPIILLCTYLPIDVCEQRYIIWRAPVAADAWGWL